MSGANAYTLTDTTGICITMYLGDNENELSLLLAIKMHLHVTHNKKPFSS